MGDLRKTKDFLNLFHVSDIFDELPVVLVPILLEQEQYKMLVLGVDPLRIFAGIRR